MPSRDQDAPNTRRQLQGAGQGQNWSHHISHTLDYEKKPLTPHLGSHMAAPELHFRICPMQPAPFPKASV